MKVSELIEILEEQNPDAEVLVMSQESWPFEMGIHGVTTRDEILRANSDGDDGDDADDDDEELADGLARSDVFLVEGRQLRYGSKTAWDVAAR
jgi:hypothetical protein